MQQWRLKAEQMHTDSDNKRLRWEAMRVDEDSAAAEGSPRSSHLAETARILEQLKKWPERGGDEARRKEMERRVANLGTGSANRRGPTAGSASGSAAGSAAGCRSTQGGLPLQEQCTLPRVEGRAHMLLARAIADKTTAHATAMEVLQEAVTRLREREKRGGGRGVAFDGEAGQGTAGTRPAAERAE